jgi:DNA-directed RNA polymerase subunit beta
MGHKTIEVLYIDNVNFSDQIRNTLLLIKQTQLKKLLLRFLKDLRPGEPPTAEAAEAIFQRTFL